MITKFSKILADFEKFIIDVKENTIRIRIQNPDSFEKDSFRTIKITNGIQAVIGKKKGEKKTTIQSLIFDRKKFNREQAVEWAEKHKFKFTKQEDFDREYMINRIEEINKLLE